MRRAVSIVLIFVMIVSASILFVGCKNELKPIGEAGFSKSAEDMKLIISDVSYSPGEQGVKIKVCAVKENEGYQLEYRRFDSVQSANTLYENFVGTLLKQFEDNDTKYTKQFNGKNYNSFTITTDTTEYKVIQIEDELMAMEVSNKDNVEEAEKVFSYIVDSNN